MEHQVLNTNTHLVGNGERRVPFHGCAPPNAGQHIDLLPWTTSSSRMSHNPGTRRVLGGPPRNAPGSDCQSPLWPSRVDGPPFLALFSIAREPCAVKVDIPCYTSLIPSPAMPLLHKSGWWGANMRVRGYQALSPLHYSPEDNLT